MLDKSVDSVSSSRYKLLDVKNILMETVSHHILPQMLVSPLWEDLSNLVNDYLKFMDDHFRESADLTFLAYRHRSYSKVSQSISSVDCILEHLACKTCGFSPFIFYQAVVQCALPVFAC